MKSLSLALATLVLITCKLSAQVAGTSAGPDPSGQSPATPYQAVAADGNSTVWERVDDFAAGTARAQAPQKHQYVQLEAGLNHLVNGTWVAFQ